MGCDNQGGPTELSTFTVRTHTHRASCHGAIGELLCDPEKEPDAPDLAQRVTDLEGHVVKLAMDLERTTTRLQGIIETHHLWDGS